MVYQLTCLINKKRSSHFWAFPMQKGNPLDEPYLNIVKKLSLGLVTIVQSGITYS